MRYSHAVAKPNGAAPRDPRTMDRDELVAYINDGGDISELLRGAVRGPDLGPAPDPADLRTWTPEDAG